MGVKMGYRKTIKPKNKNPKYIIRNETIYTPHYDENGKLYYKKTVRRTIRKNADVDNNEKNK